MYSLASAVELSQARTDSSASAGERACVSMSFAASGVENACASISSSAALVGDACVSMISSALAVESWTTWGAASDSAAARVCCAMTCAASAGERMRATQSGVDALAGTSAAAEERSGAVDAEVGAAAGASAKRWSTMPLRSERRDCCKGVGAGRESEPTWGVPVLVDEAAARGDRPPVPTGYVPVPGDEAEPAAGGAAVAPAGGTTTADAAPTPTDTGLAAGRWPRR